MLELYTDKLRLRSLRADDWDNFLMLHQDPIINQFVRRPAEESVILEKLEYRLSPWQYETGDWLTLVIEALGTDKFIGLCAKQNIASAKVLEKKWLPA